MTRSINRWTQIYLLENSVDPAQLASNEASWAASASYELIVQLNWLEIGFESDFLT